MPFILGVLIAVYLPLGFRDARKHLWRSANVCGFGSGAGYLRSGFLRVVARKVTFTKRKGHLIREHSDP
jgi:hypothetical protein